ncbi:MAG: hypothetical protein C4581_01770 [Nitrospiraceae bacterium]|nr:MAG: hypothetical protein C4581_01770 [Nitrospiraceae bacterium]
MNIEEYEEAARIAQKIDFAFEDSFQDKEQRKLFYLFFNRYLLRVDPEGDMAPYDAMVLLWRTYPDEFAHMLKEMTEKGLIPD